jgi:hypothetical protein
MLIINTSVLELPDGAKKNDLGPECVQPIDAGDHCSHCQRQTLAAWLPAFVYLKRAGELRISLAAFLWGSISH